MNNHGITWVGEGETLLDGGVTIKGSIGFAPIVDEKHRCACTKDHCARQATAEDLLCDECRAECG